MAETEQHKPLLAALAGIRQKTVPLWLMRQAGRYLPEYRSLRETAGSFLSLCYTPELAAEVSLQPVRRFPLDGLILFSDILVIPDALGRAVRFVEGTGPVLEPLRAADRIPSFDERALRHHLAPVYETVRRVKTEMPSNVTLLGFAGAPWTVATYMIEGGSSRDYTAAKSWAYREPESFGRLIARLSEATAVHLSAQLDAGVEAVQIFDSWAGVLPDDQFRRWCVAPVAEIVDRVRRDHPNARIIGFPRGAGVSYASFARETGVDAVSLDTTVPLDWAVERVQGRCAVQGNLDPNMLVVGGEPMRAAATRILDALGGGPFVFNLGHGVLPITPPDHVAALCTLVHEWARAKGAS